MSRGLTHSESRRAAMLTAALAGAVAWLVAACGPGGAPDTRFAATRLAENVLLVSGPDGNVVVAEGPDGLVVIDGGSKPNAEALLRVIERETGQRRVATLIITSWTPDRIGLNELLGARGTEIVAHLNAKPWLAYGGVDHVSGGSYAPLPESALPDRLVSDHGGSIPFGEGAVELGYLRQAHTDSDLYVRLSEANVLVTGAVVRSDGWSQIDWGAGAYLGTLADAFETLLEATDEDTIVAPGSGPVMTRADLAAQAEMYLEMFNRVSALVLDAKSPAEAVAAHPTGEFHPEWTDADIFVDRAHRSFRTHIRRDPRLGPIP
jgi:glyoxylase-like metal-dependent hydrolase (beta-lactamase superfamily II)